MTIIPKRRPTHSLVVPLLLASASAFSETPAASYGAPDCRIGTLLPAPVSNTVKWNGACKDGFADGPGTLAWNDADDSQRRIEGTLVKGVVAGEAKLTYAPRIDPRNTGTERTSYEGTFRDGQPDGQGFFQYAQGGMYEGGVAAGKPQGTGIYVSLDRSRYEGQWVDGKRQGQGKATFAVGGSYDGEWKNGQFDGVGTIVYAGTPRTWHGAFVAGLPADAARPVTAETGSDPVPGTSAQRGAGPIGSLTVPPAASWAQLSVAMQNIIKDQYYFALAPGDEPPYPVDGMEAGVPLISQIRNKIAVRGHVTILTTVGADGIATSASVVGVPANAAPYFATAGMTLKYKPAMCQDTPCTMIFPMYFYLQ